MASSAQWMSSTATTSSTRGPLSSTSSVRNRSSRSAPARQRSSSAPPSWPPIEQRPERARREQAVAHAPRPASVRQVLVQPLDQRRLPHARLTAEQDQPPLATSGLRRVLGQQRQRRLPFQQRRGGVEKPYLHPCSWRKLGPRGTNDASDRFTGSSGRTGGQDGEMDGSPGPDVPSEPWPLRPPPRFRPATPSGPTPTGTSSATPGRRRVHPRDHRPRRRKLPVHRGRPPDPRLHLRPDERDPRPLAPGDRRHRHAAGRPSLDHLSSAACSAAPSSTWRAAWAETLARTTGPRRCC